MLQGFLEVFADSFNRDDNALGVPALFERLTDQEVEAAIEVFCATSGYFEIQAE